MPFPGYTGFPLNSSAGMTIFINGILANAESLKGNVFMSEDIRWKQRFDNLQAAYIRLRQAVAANADAPDDDLSVEQLHLFFLDKAA